MNKNLSLFCLVGLVIIFILIVVYFFTKTRKGERYSTIQNRIRNIDFIEKIISSPLRLEQMIEAIQPLRATRNFRIYWDLKEIIEYLKSPNLQRFYDVFIPEVVSILSKTDEMNTLKFSQEIRQFILDLINRAEQTNPFAAPIQNIGAFGWPQVIGGGVINVDDIDDNLADEPVPPFPAIDDDDEVPIVPQPFLPFGQDNLVPQPFLP